MRYFDKQLITNSRPHAKWWKDVCMDREFFHNSEDHYAGLVGNTAALLPRNAWRDLDDITRRVMRNDEGQAYMSDLMPLAKAVNIGKLVHINRVSSDAGRVVRTMTGQEPASMDKVVHDFRGTPVPMFLSGYGRSWREWNTLQSENFDALADDQEATVAGLNRDMAQYVLRGDSSIVTEGYTGYGLTNHPLTNQIDLGTSGVNVDFTQATPAEWEAFISQTLGGAMDDNHIGVGVNMYVSPEIGRNLDLGWSAPDEFKMGSRRDWVAGSRRINKIEVSFELSGNEMLFFVPNPMFVRPLVGMAVNTIALPRHAPRANYQFDVSGALGIEVRADYNERSGVFYASEAT
ncbi:major capsid protein [uncultured Halomonas sp.]|uniref:major capsid protein n=1 Tax=uncultured Halomonas sp. TaxID=173971 RepID=UPI0026286FFD|nr:major capsid protein [uncultured Halomonas sp.]